MNRTPFRRPCARRSMQALLLSASALAVASPGLAAEVVFATEDGFAAETGRRTSQTEGLTQIRLDSGAILSFVDAADYRLNADGSVDLYAGGVTVAGAEGAETVIRMPEGVEGRVGSGAAASFSVAADGSARGHALTGAVTIVQGGNVRAFESGEMWAAHGDSLRQVVSNGAQQTPSAEAAEEPQVADMAQGGPAAAAENGIPVSLPDALAFAGASSDVVLAARNVQAAVANPALEAFPSGDLALLVSYAAQLEAPYGGQAFPGAQADVIRTYLGYLAQGGAGADFLSAYATFLTQYLDLIRAGALPSAFEGASPADIDAFIAFTGRTSGFGSLSAQNRALVEAYLQFLSSGGQPDRFARSYTDLVGAYFAFLRGGGDPLAFEAASQQTLAAYIGFLSQSGLAARLTAADRALLEAYLANGGLAFASQYRTALDAYFAYLEAGNLPSGYAGLDGATLRGYLEALQSTGLFDQALGARAEFYAAFLAHLQAGGAADAFAGLNANIFAGYATQLGAYYEFLLQGGQPTGYTALTQQQVAAYLSALQAAGASGAYLDELAEFYSGYLAYLSGGGNPDLYTGLPSLNLPGFADALNAYAAFLAGGGLPSGYTAADRATLAQYLDALARSGQLASLLGTNAGLIEAYFAWVADGGAVDRYAGLPVYASYVDALQAYHAYLAAGGLPADYTALSATQIEAYLAALAAAGGISTQLGDLSTFFTSYYAFIAGGGNPANFVGLPVYADYASALAAYYTFLEAGGLPADYTALNATQIHAYLAALAAAGGISTQLGDLATFFTSYYAFIAGGGNPANFVGLPAYADYATALQAYHAYLVAGGLPADYTALTQTQIEAYLAALSAAGGFDTQLGGLASFYGSYYAFLAGGGDPADFSGLPVYANWLAALEAYYAYLGAGGLPSGYTLLTQAQIRAYIEALDGAGVLAGELDTEALDFILAYLAFVETGADPDDFAELPVNDPAPTLLAGANVWIFSNEGGRVGVSASADVEEDGQITRTDYATDANNNVSFDYTGAGNTLREHGRVGDAVAWTRYERGAATGVTNQNIHLLLGTPAVNLPTSGAVEYKLVGGTAPTNAFAPAGEIGAFTGELAVAFGAAPRVGFAFDVHVGERGWQAGTAGGAAGAATGGLVVGSTMGFSSTDLAASGIAGNACTGYCNVSVFGGLFGDGADSAGFQYHIDDQGSGGRSYVNGVAVFGVGGTELPLIGTMPAVPEPDPEPEPAFNAVPQPVQLAYAGGFDSINPAVNFITTLRVGSGTMLPASETGSTATAYALDAGGGLTSYTRDGGTSRTNGSTTIVDVSGNADTVIGRWTEGVNTGGNPFTLSGNQGFHYLLARPVDTGFVLPTQGVIDYDLLAATRPTFVDGSAPAGGITAEMAIVLGAAPKVAFDATITMPGLVGEGDRTFRYATTGGVTDPTQTNTALTMASGGTFGIVVPGVSGADCQTAQCQFGAHGVFAGGTGQLGLTYSATNDLGDGKAIIGAAIFGNGEISGVPQIDPDTGNLTDSFVLTDMLASDSGRNDTLDLDSSGGNFGLVGYHTDGDGEIVGLEQEFGFGLSDRIGAASNADSGLTDSGALRWTRWTDGTLETVRAGPPSPVGFDQNQGYHVIVGTVATDLPASGRVDYELAGGTRPTSVAGIGEPGELTSGAAAVLFGAAPKLGIEMAFTQDGAAYAMQTVGGLADLSASEISLSADTSFRVIGTTGQGVQVDGAACATCRPIWQGFLAGPAGGELALMYTMQRQSGDRIIGSAAFVAETPTGGETGGTPVSNQAVVYAGKTVGIDMRPLADVTYNAGGAPIAYTVTANDFTRENERPTIGTAMTQDAGSVGSTIGWARWAGGTTGGRFFSDTDGMPLGANEGFHIVAGDPATNLPAGGTVTYSLAGSTKPTIADGSIAPGTFAGTMAVDFGSAPNADFAFTVGMGGADYAFGAQDREIAANMTFFANSMAVSGTGSVCPAGTCTANMRGFLAGEGATAVGVSYNFAASGGQRVAGAAAFTVGSNAPTNPYATAPDNAIAASDAWSRFGEGSGVMAGLAPAGMASALSTNATEASVLLGGQITFAGQ